MPHLITLPDAVKVRALLYEVTPDHGTLLETISNRCAGRRLEPVGVYNVIIADIGLYLQDMRLDAAAEDAVMKLGRALALKLVGEAGKQELVAHLKLLDERLDRR